MGDSAAELLRDLSFIQVGRTLEIEALEGGRRTNEFSTCPPARLEEDDAPVAFTFADDIQETAERVTDLQRYVRYAQQAFGQRELTYPFCISGSRASLESLPTNVDLARRCAEMSSMVGVGQQVAKEFELRAFRALHRLIGGWAVCVGDPRRDRLGYARAVSRFRGYLRDFERGPYVNPRPPSRGDHGLDAIWILGRHWGGPVVLLQAKNSCFDHGKLVKDFFRRSDALREWFGRRIDQCRNVITVFAVNSVLTIELKETSFEGGGGPAGFHILDSVDILHAEKMDSSFSDARDLCVEF